MVVLKSEIVQQTTDKIKMIQEKMKASQSRQNSYHDKRRKVLEFQEGDHMILRVTPITGVCRALKFGKLAPHFIGPYNFLQRVREVDYKVSLPSSILNLHDFFHVSYLWKHIPDLSHVIQLNDVQVRENLTIEASHLRIEDRKVKHLKGKEIASVKVVWGGPVGGSVT
ncbi:uncharacterized protein LOC127136860 [Lathyrus oleraceus]|uniref:uncharacterized protein LOC127136860 n=1 Tax=Pisum sativum TaxID=3888 RepID=UPI0021CEE9B2|nr:uncharacterized protein LOC127136860 [Pisum sativum]